MEGRPLLGKAQPPWQQKDALGSSRGGAGLSGFGYGRQFLGDMLSATCPPWDTVED